LAAFLYVQIFNLFTTDKAKRTEFFAAKSGVKGIKVTFVNFSAERLSGFLIFDF